MRAYSSALSQQWQRRGLVFGALGAWASQSLSQSLTPGSIIHREVAGDPDSSGWILAESTEGGFAVKVLGKYLDATLPGRDPTSPLEKAFAIYSIVGGLTKMTALRAVYRRGSVDARQVFAKLEEAAQANQNQFTRLRFGKFDAIDAIVHSKTTLMLQRSVILRADLIHLIVDAPNPAGAELMNKTMAASFFESLRVDRE